MWVNDNREIGIASDKVRMYALLRPNHLDMAEAIHNLLPQDAQLHLGQAIAHAAMNPKPKGNVMTGVGAIYDEVICLLNYRFVAITADVPHGHLVALADGLAA